MVKTLHQALQKSEVLMEERQSNTNQELFVQVDLNNLQKKKTWEPKTACEWGHVAKQVEWFCL